LLRAGCRLQRQKYDQRHRESAHRISVVFVREKIGGLS
jgi:hypothetical protein